MWRESSFLLFSYFVSFSFNSIETVPFGPCVKMMERRNVVQTTSVLSWSLCEDDGKTQRCPNYLCPFVVPVEDDGKMQCCLNCVGGNQLVFAEEKTNNC